MQSIDRSIGDLIFSPRHLGAAKSRLGDTENHFALLVRDRTREKSLEVPFEWLFLKRISKDTL